MICMNFSWDHCTGVETVIRKMIFGDINDLKELLRRYGKEGLKSVFLNNIHRFNERERSFWKVFLEVSDAEIEARAKKSFRENTAIRNFP
ncbi:MAG: hypothetical protein PWP09_1505 [Thermotogota bacterium]|nr:hypothetical protein [Thermotogota bacterium]